MGQMTEIPESPGISSCFAAVLRLNHDILRLKALWTPGHLELDLIALIELFVARTGLDGRMMHENILARRAGDKAVAFIAVKPLYCSLFFHTYLSFFVHALRRDLFGLSVFS